MTINPRLTFVLVTIGVLFLEAVVNAVFGLGAVPLAVTVVLLYIAFFIYGGKTGDHTIWLFLIFGFITGLVEVVSDCDYFLVVEQQVLVYPTGLPMIGVSPAYLPVAWGLVFTQLGLLAEWFRGYHRSLLAASAMTALVGMVMISIYETLARQALWWYYQKTATLVYSPYFVNLFEFLSSIVFVFVAWRLARGSRGARYSWAPICGVLTGLWMCVAMRFSFWLLGSCTDAVIRLPCVPLPPPPF